jgi:hypothetical protein
MRDKTRGVVWEESIILLPHKVRECTELQYMHIITVIEFAVGSICVIM